MERITIFTPAFDGRDPAPDKNYGIRGVELRMVLKGERGATQFVLHTNWMLPSVRKPFEKPLPPLPADFGYHSRTPLCGQSSTKMEKCDYFEDGCYYDGSTYQAEKIFDILTTKGDKGVWEALEKLYKQKFGKLI